MAKIKHIAIATQDPDKTAGFYKGVFDLQEVGRVDNDNAEGYYLSDGMSTWPSCASRVRSLPARSSAPRIVGYITSGSRWRTPPIPMPGCERSSRCPGTTSTLRYTLAWEGETPGETSR